MDLINKGKIMIFTALLLHGCLANQSVKNDEIDNTVKYDNQHREIYRYNLSTKETYETFYGNQYKEINYFIKDKFPNDNNSTTKYYYESNRLKKIVFYQNNKLVGYRIYKNEFNENKSDFKNTRYILEYDKNGKYIPNLYCKLNLKRLRRLSQKNEKDRNRITELEKELDIPDLNLTLEKQFFEKIDKLNRRKE